MNRRAQQIARANARQRTALMTLADPRGGGGRRGGSGGAGGRQP